MFEAQSWADDPKEQYKAQVPQLRIDLLEVPQGYGGRGDFRSSRFCGRRRRGQGETVQLLTNGWIPRWLVMRAFGEPYDEEQERAGVLALLAGPSASRADGPHPQLLVFAGPSSIGLPALTAINSTNS